MSLCCAWCPEACIAQTPASDAAKPERSIVPFDFESKFDDGRYGQMVGDMIWKKLERQGGVVIPESMMDVRDWIQRNKLTPSPATPLDRLQRIVRDDFDSQVAIWGSIERVPGTQFDEYDFEIRVADFAVEPPRVVFSKKARTKTVSEIPHVYVKEALDRLFDRKQQEEQGPDLAAEERWKSGVNLVTGGDFERPRGATGRNESGAGSSGKNASGRDNFERDATGTPSPLGWDPLGPNVKWVVAPTDNNPKNHAIRFTFDEAIAGSSGVLYYSDFFPVDEGAKYRFQVRWRTTGSAVKVFIKCYDEFSTKFDESGKTSERREVYRSQQNFSGPAKTWNVHTEDFTPRHVQFTPRWGRVMLYAYWPAGSVEFDDVVVKQIGPPPPDVKYKVRRPSLETKVLTEELDRTKGK